LADGQITLRDVYEAQLRTAEQVASLASQVSQLTARMDERLDTGTKKMDDHELRIRVLEGAPDVPADLETRVRSLEKLAWKLIGAFAAVNALAVLAEWFLWAHK
jgi:hypothetical protein